MSLPPKTPFHAGSARGRRHAGVTLVELMIALVLAALVVLAATAMVVTSRTSYRTQDETTRMAESARFALELTNRMLRLSGYTNFGDDLSIPAFYAPDPAWASAPDSYASNGPDLVGSANSKPGGGPAYNNSDSLTIRYFGANMPGDADFGAILDCAGYPVPQPTGAPASSLALVNRTSRAFSILFVDLDKDGEPALRCKRQTYNTTSAPGSLTGITETQTLIRGVEEMRVLYGEALYTPGSDPDLVAAPAIAYRGGIGSANPVGDWSNVVSVKVSMLLRSAPGARADLDKADYDLLGADYAAIDPTTRFSTAALSGLERSRSRRVVQTTVFIRNRLSAWPSLNVE